MCRCIEQISERHLLQKKIYSLPGIEHLAVVGSSSTSTSDYGSKGPEIEPSQGSVIFSYLLVVSPKLVSQTGA